MGALASKPQGSGELDRKLLHALQARAAERDRAAPPRARTLDSVLLLFPKTFRGLEQLRAVFATADADGDGLVDVVGLKACFRALNVATKDADVDELCSEFEFEPHDSDSGAGSISFRDFVLALAVLYLIGPLETDDVTSSSELAAPPRIGLPDAQAALETIVEAFLMFDTNRDGLVSREEICAVIPDATMGKQSSSHLAVDLFAEMDCNKDGRVTFKDFLFAFANWVGLGDEDEDEDKGEDGDGGHQLGHVESNRQEDEAGREEGVNQQEGPLAGKQAASAVLAGPLQNFKQSQ
eukprot:SM000082S22829  [mRNA]  locus=s82:205097:206464:+ [translate_table: standard]